MLRSIIVLGVFWVLATSAALARPDEATIAACAGLEWQSAAFSLTPGLQELLQPEGMKAEEAFGDTDELTVLDRNGTTIWCKYVSTTPDCFAPGYEKLKAVLTLSPNPLAHSASVTSDRLKAANDRFEVVTFIYAATKNSDGHWTFSGPTSDTPGLETARGRDLLNLFAMGAFSAYAYCNAAHASPQDLREHLDYIVSLFLIPGSAI